ncbi:MAG: hypothetical protein M3N82_01290, partial [Pseudomonadota bacterium]|nr:hypothetical protein [Pseudomonadota bacterium]
MLVHALLLRYRRIPIAEKACVTSSPCMVACIAASGNLLPMPLNAEKTDPLVQLHRVRLKVVEKRWMVYVGTEDIWKRKNRESHPQALWCWPS